MGDTFELMRTLEEPPAGQRGHRRGRLHRPRDGRGPHRPGSVGHPVRAAPRGAPDRRPRARGPGQRRADRARRRRADRHHRQADRPGTARFGRPPPGRRRRVARRRRRPPTPTWCWSSSACVPTPRWPRRRGRSSGIGGRSASTGACGPTSTTSSPPATASSPTTACSA